MHKINEQVDLSKKVLDIDIESPIFNKLLNDLNQEIERVIQKVYDNEFEAGEITVKLSIEIPNDYENIPRENDFGEMIQETIKFRKPCFQHKVTTTLKKKYVTEGQYAAKRDIQLIDGKFVAVPIEDPQTKLELK